MAQTRRAFLLSGSALAGSALATGVVAGKTGAPSSDSPGRRIMAGIQTAPLEFLDHGVSACLDHLQETAGVNAVFCYGLTYHLGESPKNVLSTERPWTPRDPRGRSLRYCWMDLPSAPFRDLCLGHEELRTGAEYADRDLFSELVKPCRERGIAVYVRFLEASMARASRIPGYTRVATVERGGKPGHGPCWNHPDYREWLSRTAAAMVTRYPLDGLQYGAERVGSLSDVLFKGGRASCFCEHCRRRNEAAGIDWKDAEAGLGELESLMESVAAGNPPHQGVLAEVLGCLFRHPMVLPFFREWLRADQEIHASIYRSVKAVRPGVDVGQHVDHQKSSWDLFFRAAVSYADMAEHADFIKPILYHEILGPRLKEWVVDAMKGRVLADFSEDQITSFFYSAFGHPRGSEPGYNQLMETGLSPEYVYRETLRCVKGTAGKARVYAGIGLDVPHYVPGGMQPVPSDPESVHRAVTRALEAGADGVLASREYAEMSDRSLRAFGRAVRDHL